MANQGDGAHYGLSRFSLEQHTEAIRRDDARRRGRSTPSPEPDIHEYESDLFTPSRVQRRPQMTAEEQERSRREIDVLWAEQNKKAAGFGELQREARTNHPGFVGKPTPSAGLGTYGGHCMVPANATHGEVLGSTKGNENAAGPDRDGMTDAQWELHLEEIEDLKAGFGQQKETAHDEHEVSESVPQSAVSPRANRPEPHLPPNFPSYHVTRNINEVAAYLANASYVVSLGGAALSDIKYGVIVVPVGEESLLFGPRPDNIFTRDFLDAVQDANETRSVDLHMHGMDSDSDEFLRHRFRDDFSERPAESHRNVEAEEPRRPGIGHVPENASRLSSDKGEGETRPAVGGARDEEMEAVGRFGIKAAGPTGARSSVPAPTRTRTGRGKGLAPGPNTRKPQGITKARSSPGRRGGFTGTGASPVAATKRRVWKNLAYLA